MFQVTLSLDGGGGDCVLGDMVLADHSGVCFRSLCLVMGEVEIVSWRPGHWFRLIRVVYVSGHSVP